MFKGAVNFRARIKGSGLTFPLVAFYPKEPGVDKVEIEGPKGDEIHTTVHLASVASHDDGRALATKVNTAALNRICFNNNIAIENARNAGDQFSPLNPQSGGHMFVSLPPLTIHTELSATLAISADKLKTELEQASPHGEDNYGLFRSARQSVSPVEEFMHLYNILLMIYNDKQADVDSFIISEDPTVPQTKAPPKKPGALGKMETVYTRLRNELAHKRTGVNLENTKSEMSQRLGGLIRLTKRAIEVNP
jgi:hypothetical protein